MGLGTKITKVNISKNVGIFIFGKKQKLLKIKFWVIGRALPMGSGEWECNLIVQINLSTTSDTVYVKAFCLPGFF